MPSFSLVIEYLTGYAVATDPANREQAEWPPHPARIFMALAAAHFEADPANVSQRDALEWLATLPPPEITIPCHAARDVRTVYVPVNDQTGADALLTRSRQPRFFPRVYIGAQPYRQTWHFSGERPSERLIALESICRNVTRIGHSSSLVWVRLERDSAVQPTHVPDEHALGMGMRIAQAGALKRLEEAFNKEAIDEFVNLEAEVIASKGPAKKLSKERIGKRFPQGRPTPQRPVFSISRAYRPVEVATDAAPQSLFDPNFIVLRESNESSQKLGLESTAQVVQALRRLIMSESKVQPVPPWVGGHEADGGKLESAAHMALIPLPFVGSAYADGHLMGVGIVLPRELPYRERSKVLSSILFDEATNEPRTIELTMGRTGVWKVARQTDPSPKTTLQTGTYTAPSRRWASVTPVLLDRMPKSDRATDPIGWRVEVAGIIAQSCQRVGLPEPIAVRAEKTPFFCGSLRAMPGQGGFPQLRKDKFQVHIQIEFEQLVQGPVLLGAGRFRGFGLMRPWQSVEGR